MSAAGPIPPSKPPSFTITDELRKDFFEKSLFPPTLNISTLKDSSNKASPEKIKNHIITTLRIFFQSKSSLNFDDAFIQDEELQKMYINATYQLVGRCGGDDDTQQQTRFDVFRLMFEDCVTTAPRDTNFDTLKKTFTIIHANTSSSEEATKLIEADISTLQTSLGTAESDTKILKKDLPAIDDPMYSQNLNDTLLAQQSNLVKTNKYNRRLEKLLENKKAKIDNAARLISRFMKKHRGKINTSVLHNNQAIKLQRNLRMLLTSKKKAAIVEEMKTLRTAIEQLKKLDSASAANFETELQTLEGSAKKETITLKELNQALKKAKQLNENIKASNHTGVTNLGYQNKTNKEKIESIRKKIADSRLPEEVKEQFNTHLDAIKDPAANLKEAKGIQESLTKIEDDLKRANSDQGVERLARGFLGRIKARNLKRQTAAAIVIQKTFRRRNQGKIFFNLLKERNTKLQRNAFEQWRSFTAEQKAEKAKKAIQEQQQSEVQTLLKKRNTKLKRKVFDQWRSFTAKQKAEKEVKEITVNIKDLLKEQYFSTEEIQAYQLSCTEFENAIYNKDYNHNKNIRDARGLKTSLDSIIQKKIEIQTLLQETKEAKKVAEAAEQERRKAEANLTELFSNVKDATIRSIPGLKGFYKDLNLPSTDTKENKIKFTTANFKKFLLDILNTVPKHAGREEDLAQYRDKLSHQTNQTPQKWGEDILNALEIYNPLADSINADQTARDELTTQIERFHTITKEIPADLTVSELDDLHTRMKEIEKEHNTPTRLIGNFFNTDAANIIDGLTASITTARETKEAERKATQKQQQSKEIKKITDAIRTLLQENQNDKETLFTSCDKFEKAIDNEDYNHDQNIKAATALETSLKRFYELQSNKITILLDNGILSNDIKNSSKNGEINQSFLDSLATRITAIKTHNKEVKAFNSTTPVEQIEEINLAESITPFFKQMADKLHQYYTKEIVIDNAEGLKLTIRNLSQSIDGLKTFAGKHGLEIDLTTLENLLLSWTRQHADLTTYLTELRTLEESTKTLEKIDQSTMSLTELYNALEEAKSLELPNLPETLPDFKFLSREVQSFHLNFTNTTKPALINSLRVKLIAQYKYLISAEYFSTQKTGFNLKAMLKEATKFCMELDSDSQQKKDLFQAITEAYTRLLAKSPSEEKAAYLALANQFFENEFSTLSPKFQPNKGEPDWKGPFINAILEARRSLEMGKSASTGDLRPKGGKHHTLISSSSQQGVGRREDGSNSAKKRTPRGSEVEGRRGVVLPSKGNLHGTGGARVAWGQHAQEQDLTQTQHKVIQQKLFPNPTNRRRTTHKEKTVSGLTGVDKVTYQEIASQFNGFMQRFQTSDGKTMNTDGHLLEITHANKEKCLAVVKKTITYVREEERKANHLDKDKFDTLLKKLISDQKKLNDLFSK